MCGTPLIAFSSGAATVSSSTLADAPGYTAVTVTTGGAISGYWAIGRLRIAESPASTRKIEITAAKIGRSMKKRENMSGYPLFLGGFGRRLAGARRGRRRRRLLLRRLLGRRLRRCAARCIRDRAGGRRRRASRELDRLTRHHDLGDAVDDYVVAGVQSRLDNPQVRAVAGHPFAELHRLRHRDVLAVLVLAGDVDEFALRPVEHRGLRNGDRIEAHRSVQRDPHELAGAERVIGVRE